MKLTDFSLEDKRLYASSCLRNYCDLLGISHPAISELLNHLDSITSGQSVADWDEKGALLDLNGRGDPIPESLRSMMSGDDLSDFENLVDSVVEVGIVDLYGAKTDLPLKFLAKAMLILEKRGVPLPGLSAR